MGALFKSGYGVGQMVESIATVTLNTYLFYYLTNVCGLSGSLTGVALFLALAIDAVADPVVGSISDHLMTRWGRRVPVMAVSLVPLAVSFGLLFSVPHLDSGWPLFGYVFVILVALRISMSGFIVPYLSLGAEISTDYDDRSNIVAFRVIFGILGPLVAYLLGFGVFLSGPRGLLNRPGYAPFGWTCAALAWTAGAVACIVSLRAAPVDTHRLRSERSLAPRLAAEVREVFRNPLFRLLFGGVLVFFVSQGLTTALTLHANQYFWSLNVKQIQVIAMSMVAGLAAGLPIAFAVIGRIEKRTMVLGGIAAFAIAQGLPACAEVAGLLPPDIDLNVEILFVAGLIIGIATTLVVVSFQSAMADAVDEHEHLFGTRREGIYFASLSFASKAATGLGSMMAGFLLDWIHFPSAEIASGRHVTVAPQILRNLGLLYGPAAAFITLSSLVFFARYRLDRAAHAAILAELAR